MKRTVAMILSLVLLITALAGCGGNSGGTTTTAAPAGTTAQGGDSKTADWPKQPVNVMCPAAAGGGTDNILRLMNGYFTKKTGNAFVITNQTGIAGYEAIHQAQPDGYNFICGTTTIFTSKLDGTLSYDWEDYEMVSYFDSPYNGSCIAVQASSPYQTLKDLLEAIKADQTIMGGITLTGQPMMIHQGLEKAVGFTIPVSDTGNAGERNAALLGGHVAWILNNTSSCDPYVQSGDFRILAVCGEERYPMNPDIPTIKEAGYDFSFPSQPLVWLAPKGTPKEVCEAFNKILVEIMNDADFQKELKEKLNNVPWIALNIEDSIKTGQKYKDTLAPYVK